MYCDEMYKDIKKLLRLTQCKSVEEFFFKYKGKKKFPKTLVYFIFFKLKRNSFYHLGSMEFLQNAFLEIKKKYRGT